MEVILRRLKLIFEGLTLRLTLFNIGSCSLTELTPNFVQFHYWICLQGHCKVVQLEFKLWTGPLVCCPAYVPNVKHQVPSTKYLEDYTPG